MNELRKAAEMALDSILDIPMDRRSFAQMEAVTALRQALAQPDEVLAEREACALICENMERNGAWITKSEAAEAIRARGIDAARVGEVGIWGEK